MQKDWLNIIFWTVVVIAIGMAAGYVGYCNVSKTTGVISAFVAGGLSAVFVIYIHKGESDG